MDDDETYKKSNDDNIDINISESENINVKSPHLLKNNINNTELINNNNNVLKQTNENNITGIDNFNDINISESENTNANSQNILKNFNDNTELINNNNNLKQITDKNNIYIDNLINFHSELALQLMKSDSSSDTEENANYSDITYNNNNINNQSTNNQNFNETINHDQNNNNNINLDLAVLEDDDELEIARQKRIHRRHNFSYSIAQKIRIIEEAKRVGNIRATADYYGMWQGSIQYGVKNLATYYEKARKKPSAKTTNKGKIPFDVELEQQVNTWFEEREMEDASLNK